MILGEKIGLRLIEEKDLLQLMRWRNDPRTLINLNTQLEISLAGQKKYFDDLMNDPSRMQFMIMRLDDNLAIGTIGLSKIDYRNQSARPAPFQIDVQYRPALLGIDALNTLFRYAFEELNLNRLYGSVLDLNKPVLLGMQAMGMKQEGLARRAIFVQGEWHDMVFYGLLRSEWHARQNGRRNGGVKI